MGPLTGSMLRGRYRIVDRLGEGGMGVVFVAEDVQLQRRVAIKTIARTREERDGDLRVRLLREARAAASVNHPHICQIYEVAEDEAGLFIAMELLAGEPLSARLARGAMPLPEAAAATLQVLSALEALHRGGFVHRDLKPSNVFLTPFGAKLLDFGLARDVRESLPGAAVTATLAGTVVGSPGYMAPEQIQGGVLDARADLFAAGVMLYEMLVGRPLFAGRTVAQALHAAMHEHPPALAGSPAIIATDRVIRRALAKRPDDRYPDAAAMAADLRAVLTALDSGEVPQAYPMTRLVVLPFRILRPDAETDFLAFSLADAIGSTLSALGSLIVRSSVLAARFASGPLDLREISRDAEVDVVLTGTQLRAGDQLRVSVQLLAAPEGTILWSQTSQVPFGDIFQLQDDLARRIVQSLSLPLTAREHRLLGRDVPVNAKAYELFLRANQHFYDVEHWVVARDLYLECVAEDPQYAPAWARLGRCHRLAAKFLALTGDEVSRNLQLARSAFRRALELNPDLPGAHHLYTALETDLGQSAEAIVRLLEQARMRPSDPELYAGLVHACRYAGLLDASLAAHERARHLDPQVPSSVVHTHWMKGEYERALDERIGGFNVGYVVAVSLAMLGREAEAIVQLRRRERSLGETAGAAYLRALRMLLEGDADAAVAAIDQTIGVNPDPESVFYQARTLARLGLQDRALAELDRVVSGGYYCYSTLVGDPWLDVLRARPEFTAILHRAEHGRREAAARYLAAGGDKLLGVFPA